MNIKVKLLDDRDLYGEEYMPCLVVGNIYYGTVKDLHNPDNLVSVQYGDGIEIQCFLRRFEVLEDDAHPGWETP